MKSFEFIENTIFDTWDVGGISDEEYTEFEESLLELEKDNPEVIRLLAEVYIHKSNHILQKAADLCLDGLEKYPAHTGICDYYNIAANGYNVDFKKRNRMMVINDLARVRSRCPESTITRRILIENLISNYRFDDAIVEIKAFKEEIGNPYFISLFEGEIEFLRGNRKMGFDIWDNTIDSFRNEYRCFYGVADLYAGFAMYNKAITLYWKSFSIQAKPRNIDGLISLFQIYEILDDSIEYKKVINQIIRVFADDYSLTEGAEVQLWKDRLNRATIGTIIKY